MDRFKNISLVFECDPPTLERAAALAQDNRARLTLVYPVPETSGGWLQSLTRRKAADVARAIRQEHEDHLKEAAEYLRSMGVRVGTRLMVGEPSLEIIRDVIENERDLVVMTAEGAGGLKKWLFGTVSARLMRKCPAPILAMKPGRRKRFQRILAAIDPTPCGSPRDTLNGLILELAASLSERDDAHLHVVHAWTLVGESILRGQSGLPAREVNRLVRVEGEKQRRRVEELICACIDEPHRLHLIKGDPAGAICSLVKKLKIDLLVMGTVCRTGIPGIIVGNTAENVLNSVDCSVLTVKPEGFVSPAAALVASRRA
jgi:universal stress protein E